MDIGMSGKCINILSTEKQRETEREIFIPY